MKRIIDFNKCVLLTWIVILGFCCQNTSKKTSKTIQQSNPDELKYRPVYHFSPQKNWMNDPNGLFYLNGTYHLYFQHNPNDNVWGPMHWGHATSEDLLRWTEHPIAIYPDDLGTIFSGSAVVDQNNTSGFGKENIPPIIAIYTNHDHRGHDKGRNDYQTQSIAYSLDGGFIFTKFKDNPVISNPGIKDFRDPKVSWIDKYNKWVMSLAVGQEIYFYDSKDLKSWNFLSSFGEGIGNHDGVWECPDLIELPIEGTNTKKWVLLVSINPGGPNGGSATQYFVGKFNGQEFLVDEEFEKTMKEQHDYWIDFGKDNYAGVTYSNIETTTGKKIFHGWMSNWLYANIVPTTTWRSTMTIPREISLVRDRNTYRIKSIPVQTLDKFRNLLVDQNSLSLRTEIEKESDVPALETAEILFKTSADTNFRFALNNQIGDTLNFGYNQEKNSFYIDRSKAGITNFSDDFVKVTNFAPRISDNIDITGQVLLDKASIEIFYDAGLNVLTEIFFVEKPLNELRITQMKGPGLKNFQINQLNF